MLDDELVDCVLESKPFAAEAPDAILSTAPCSVYLVSAVSRSRLLSVTLHACRTSRQRFESVAEYKAAVHTYLRKELEKHREIEDGITGKKLDIEEQLAYI